MPIAPTCKLGVLLSEHEVTTSEDQYIPTLRMHLLKGNLLLSNLLKFKSASQFEIHDNVLLSGANCLGILNGF